MKVSAKTEYACIAVLELAAAHGTDEPVRIRTIAERHEVPARFLVQILLQLKGAGLVVSTRGASGGYQLARPPEEITLATVMEVIEGPSEGGSSGNASPTSVAARVLGDVWREITTLEQEMLKALTFTDLIERAQQQDESMYYI